MKFNVTNGYKVRASSAWELVKMLEDTRAQCSVIKDREVPKMAAQVAAYSVDMAAIGRNKERSNVEMIHGLFAYLAGEEGKAKAGAAGPGTDWSFNLVLMPLKPSMNPLAKDEYLALAFTRQDEFIKIWESFDNVEQFNYVHGSEEADMPDGVDLKSWEARLEAWESVLTCPAPKLCGVEYIISDTGLRGMFSESKEDAIEQLLMAWPSFEERLTILSNSVALATKQKALMKRPRGIVTPDGQPTEKQSKQELAGKATKEAIDWLSTKPKELGELRVRYAAKLDKEPRERHLTGKTTLVV